LPINQQQARIFFSQCCGVGCFVAAGAVVGDNVMLTVATSDMVVGPTRLLFPRAPGGIGEVRIWTHEALLHHSSASLFCITLLHHSSASLCYLCLHNTTGRPQTADSKQQTAHAEEAFLHQAASTACKQALQPAGHRQQAASNKQLMQPFLLGVRLAS
jgi:hypothetical protein